VSGGEKPTYILSVLHKESKKKGKVGAAWLKPDGSISIRLEAGVTISWKDDFVISLFPNRAGDSEYWNRRHQHENNGTSRSPTPDDEPPFGNYEDTPPEASE
jgi:hypothetical protein